jgi:hypothetical protein
VRENGESGIVDQLLFGLEAVFEGVESGGRTMSAQESAFRIGASLEAWTLESHHGAAVAPFVSECRTRTVGRREPERLS